MAPGATIFLRLEKGIDVGRKMKFRVWTLEIGVQVLLSAHESRNPGNLMFLAFPCLVAHNPKC